MGVKDIAKREVPDFVKRCPEWPVFLKWIDQNKVKTIPQLKSTLKMQIDTCDKIMKNRMREMRLGTNTRIVRKCAKEMDFLKCVRDRIVKYL